MINLEKLLTTMTFGESLLYKKLVGRATQHFQQSMEEDLYTVLAALVFISERRLNARYTWAEAQEIPISELQDRFDFGDTAEDAEAVVEEEDPELHSPVDDIVIDDVDEESLPREDEEDEELEEFHAYDMAQFVVAIGMSPSEYWNLTQLQHDAIIAEFNKRNK